MSCDDLRLNHLPSPRLLCEQLGGVECIVKQLSNSRAIDEIRPTGDNKEDIVKIWTAALVLALGCKDDKSIRMKLFKPNVFRMLIGVVGSKDSDDLVRFCSTWSIAVFLTECNELPVNQISHFGELMSGNKVMDKLCTLLGELSNGKHKTCVNWKYFACLFKCDDEHR